MCMSPVAAEAGTLKSIKERGKLLCGVSEGLAGFSESANGKDWSGFDVDFCRAVSAAIFGNPDKVEYLPLSAKGRFDALHKGKIDVLSRNTTWTLGRDVDAALTFAGVSYYDGQGFMTSVENGLSSALELSGAKICVLAGTTTLANTKAFFERNRMKVEILEFDKREGAIKAYERGECTAYTSDRSALASVRTKLAKPNDHMLLPEVISKEPLGPVVRQDDPIWAETVRWTLFLLINAEEAGWSSKTADITPDTIPLDVLQAAATKMGVGKDWARNVILTVGNYAEIFNRNVGKDSPLKLERGLNALWTNGGIMYAPPMR
ncbi:MAG: amino acid ABC transporter substrate-binding protein [Hyphomicrobiaceae bacterium]|nr:amino acid ABC transporter substrate-binding protein [Hyphomicrobiaceae bacterium]